MIRFLIKGLFRDKNRSVLPAIVVTIGVMITVFLHCYLTGVIGDMVDTSAGLLPDILRFSRKLMLKTWTSLK